MSDLTVQVEEVSPVVKRLLIDVPAARVSQVTDSVYRKLGNSVRLPGYRQGHIPRRVLEKHFADRVKTDVAREVVQSTFPEALGTTNLSPVAEPTVEPEDLKPGVAFHYSARIEVRPEVTLVQYKGLEIEVPETKVTDFGVAARLEALREEHSTLKPIEDRTEVALGDYADVKYVVDIPGSGRPPQEREGGLVHVVPGLFIEGNGEKLVGQKVGETREFTEHFTEEAAPELRGKEAHVKATVSGLKKRELPALDDEFAKDARSVDTLAELRTKVRAELEAVETSHRERATRDAALGRLVEVNPVEVPPSLVDSSAERMVYDVIRNFMGRGLDPATAAPIVERMKKEVAPRALTDVKTYFLLDAVAQTEKFEATTEDVQKKIRAIAEQEQAPMEKISARYHTPKALAGLKGMIVNDKAVQFVIDAAKITLKPADEAPKATESGAAV